MSHAAGCARIGPGRPARASAPMPNTIMISPMNSGGTPT